MTEVVQVDVFSLAAAVTALLLAAALLVAYAIIPRLKGFVWWAGSFALLAVWLATATLRFDTPIVAILWLSWGSFYAAACLVANGLHRQGATPNSPLARMLACGALFVATATALTVFHARPSHWFLAGPIPTLVFMAWSAVLVFRARAWGYGLTLVAGIVTVTLLSLIHPGGLARALSPDRPPSTLRGGFSEGPDTGASISLDPRGAQLGALDFTPPPGPHPPVEQPLAVTLITVMALLAMAIALVLRDLLTELDRMRQRSSIDVMTGLLNRATFEETATAVLREPGIRPIYLILFDIDHFKRINDTVGHAAGDLVISRLGQLLRDVAGPLGMAGRVGGEEFAVILADGNLGTARQFADAIRAGLSSSDFGDDIGWTITVSAGIARHLTGESLRSLSARADKALYAAKEGGRDTVVIALDPTDERDRQSPNIRLTANAKLA